MARRPQPKPYLNPAYRGVHVIQDNVVRDGNATELRQTLGSGKIAEIFKRGARHQPICPKCGLEVAPGERGEVFHLGSTPYERILILSGHESEIVYHKECDAPTHNSLLDQILNK